MQLASVSRSLVLTFVLKTVVCLCMCVSVYRVYVYVCVRMFIECVCIYYVCVCLIFIHTTIRNVFPSFGSRTSRVEQLL